MGTLAAWAKPASASNWSVTRIQAGADLEATLCFKCHSAFSWGSGSPPAVPAGSACYNGPYVWGCFPLTIPSTDQAREFNPANAAQGGYHPVLADCSNNYSRIVDLNNLSQTAVRTWSKTSRNRMTCSD